MSLVPLSKVQGSRFKVQGSGFPIGCSMLDVGCWMFSAPLSAFSRPPFRFQRFSVSAFQLFPQVRGLWSVVSGPRSASSFIIQPSAFPGRALSGFSKFGVRGSRFSVPDWMFDVGCWLFPLSEPSMSHGSSRSASAPCRNRLQSRVTLINKKGPPFPVDC